MQKISKLFLLYSFLFVMVISTILIKPANALAQDDDGGCGDEPNCEDVVVEETKSKQSSNGFSMEEFMEQLLQDLDKIPDDYDIPGPPEVDQEPPEDDPDDDAEEKDPCAEAMEKIEEIKKKIREAERAIKDSARKIFGEDGDLSVFQPNHFPFAGFDPTAFNEEGEEGTRLHNFIPMGDPDEWVSPHHVSYAQDEINSLFRELFAAMLAAARACGDDGMMTPLRDDQKEE